MALIHYAAKFGTVELMQIILNIEGVLLKLKNSSGKTARMIASDPLVRRLLDAVELQNGAS